MFIYSILVIVGVLGFRYVHGVFQMLRGMQVTELRQRWCVARSERQWYERERQWIITSDDERYQQLLLQELGAFELYAMSAPHHARVEDPARSYTTPLYDLVP